MRALNVGPLPSRRWWLWFALILFVVVIGLVVVDELLVDSPFVYSVF